MMTWDCLQAGAEAGEMLSYIETSSKYAGVIPGTSTFEIKERDEDKFLFSV